MSTLAICIFILSTIIATSLAYLCLQNQRLLTKPLTTIPWMSCAALVHLNAFFTAHTYIGPWKALAVMGLANAIMLVLISFFDSFLRKRRSTANYG
ncbi:hypothetical protein H8K35_05070 [Undibacterium sp. LX40W]|uniref:Uncharacterized protein n=1 Tax=Undibacterium nitidum TaxID=2762298 RepID=A0A923HKX0_9BURK|nr:MULTISPECIES: hypothetical protein [Undibacterium]MBC3880243.1 hypothetical protein [Undibacterium nitidum]MBC3891021.1 hypothetical protein [Undibacterium sp. LX40W]